MEKKDITKNTLIIPHPSKFRETPSEELTRTIIEAIDAQYGLEKKHSVLVDIPEYMREFTYHIMEVAKEFTNKSWDVMILGEFKPTNHKVDFQRRLIKGLYLVLRPAAHDTGKVIPNWDRWQMKDGNVLWDTHEKMEAEKNLKSVNADNICINS